MKAVTQQQILQWKEKHVQLIKITDDTNENEAYFKNPTISILEKYTDTNDEDVYIALQQLFDSCILKPEGLDIVYDDEFIISAAKSIIQKVNTDKNATINTNTGKDEIKKSAALIRHYFHVDPYKLSTDEFYKLLSEALWLQDHKNKQLEFALANVLVKTFANQP